MSSADNILFLYVFLVTYWSTLVHTYVQNYYIRLNMPKLLQVETTLSIIKQKRSLTAINIQSVSEVDCSGWAIMIPRDTGLRVCFHDALNDWRLVWSCVHQFRCHTDNWANCQHTHKDLSQTPLCISKNNPKLIISHILRTTYTFIMS